MATVPRGKSGSTIRLPPGASTIVTVNIKAVFPRITKQYKLDTKLYRRSRWDLRQLIEGPPPQPPSSVGVDLALLLLNDPTKFQAAFALKSSRRERFRLKLKGRTAMEIRKRARVQARAVEEYVFA